MLLEQLANRLTQWLSTARQIDKVRFLDDRLLADMGIERREIASRVKGR
jgi:uncharacterized protein YjiS (DUF1127 family)